MKQPERLHGTASPCVLVQQLGIDVHTCPCETTGHTAHLASGVWGAGLHTGKAQSGDNHAMVATAAVIVLLAAAMTLDLPHLIS